MGPQGDVERIDPPGWAQEESVHPGVPLGEAGMASRRTRFHPPVDRGAIKPFSLSFQGAELEIKQHLKRIFVEDGTVVPEDLGIRQERNHQTVPNLEFNEGFNRAVCKGPYVADSKRDD